MAKKVIFLHCNGMYGSEAEPRDSVRERNFRMNGEERHLMNTNIIRKYINLNPGPYRETSSYL